MDLLKNPTNLLKI